MWFRRSGIISSSRFTSAAGLVRLEVVPHVIDIFSFFLPDASYPYLLAAHTKPRCHLHRLHILPCTRRSNLPALIGCTYRFSPRRFESYLFHGQFMETKPFLTFRGAKPNSWV